MEQLLITLISVLIGAILGFGGSIFIQKWTQERAWEREYKIKTIDKIYAPLYEEILKLKGFFESFKEIELNPGYPFPGDMERYYPLDNWNDIKKSHRYHMILDKKFRSELDSFFQKVVEYTYSFTKSFENILQLSKQLLKPEGVVFDIGWMKVVAGAMFQGEDFDEYTFQLFGGIKGTSSEHILGQWKLQKIEVTPDFFTKLLNRADDEPMIRRIRAERNELLSKCDVLLDTLAKKIEEPWKV